MLGNSNKINPPSRLAPHTITGSPKLTSGGAGVGLVIRWFGLALEEKHKT